jgi:hypothetical protein
MKLNNRQKLIFHIAKHYSEQKANEVLDNDEKLYGFCLIGLKNRDKLRYKLEKKIKELTDIMWG